MSSTIQKRKHRQKTVADYTKSIENRLDYFRSYGLFRKQVFLVRCFFSNEIELLEFGIQGADLIVNANRDLFKENPRLVAHFLTKQEMDPDKWREKTEKALDEQVSLAESMLTNAGKAWKIDTKKLLNEQDKKRIREWLLTNTALPVGSLIQLQKNRADLYRDYFRAHVRAHFRMDQEDVLDFGYISTSTKYVLNAVSSLGFAAVSSILREATMSSTKDYTKPNQEFIAQFSQDLAEKKLEIEPEPVAIEHVAGTLGIESVVLCLQKPTFCALVAGES